MSLSVMSADSHMDLIYLPPDTFTARMPSTWRDRAPQVVERDGRKVWVSGNAVLGPWGIYGPGVTGGRRGRILAEAGFASGKQTRPSNPLERREDQERDGVEAEVIYGIIGSQASPECLLQASDVRDVPEGLPRRARDGGDRARQRHVGLGLSAPGRHVAVLEEGDRGAVPRHRPGDSNKDALGERAPRVPDRRTEPGCICLGPPSVKAVLMDRATTKTVVAPGGEGIGGEIVDATCEILRGRTAGRRRGAMNPRPV